LYYPCGVKGEHEACSFFIYIINLNHSGVFQLAGYSPKMELLCGQVFSNNNLDIYHDHYRFYTQKGLQR
jgi:hypothetical protein